MIETARAIRLSDIEYSLDRPNNTQMLHNHQKTTLTVRKNKHKWKSLDTLEPFKRNLCLPIGPHQFGTIYRSCIFGFVFLLNNQQLKCIVFHLYQILQQRCDGQEQRNCHYNLFWKRNTKSSSVLGWCDYCWSPRWGLYKYMCMDTIQSQHCCSSTREANLKNHAFNRLDFS